MTSLIERTQCSLGLSPSFERISVDAGPPVGKGFGGLSGIAIGSTELRNEEGSGHGRSRGPALTSRHARLAVTAATAWCEIVLDTFEDQSAPWHRKADFAAGDSDSGAEPPNFPTKPPRLQRMQLLLQPSATLEGTRVASVAAHAHRFGPCSVEGEAVPVIDLQNHAASATNPSAVGGTAPTPVRLDLADDRTGCSDGVRSHGRGEAPHTPVREAINSGDCAEASRGSPSTSRSWAVQGVTPSAPSGRRPPRFYRGLRPRDDFLVSSPGSAPSRVSVEAALHGETGGSPVELGSVDV